jgi:hypothetical protein
MPIPRQKDRHEKRQRAAARIARQQQNETKDIERCLRKALQYSILVDNGDTESAHDRDACIDMAIARGMAKDAITVGTHMTKKLKDLLGHKPEAHSRAMGLLLVVEDMLAGADTEAAALVQQAIARIQPLTTNTAAERWRNTAIPVHAGRLPQTPLA